MTAETKAKPTGELEQVRIDKWLWAARLFKTRSQAGKACTAGKVMCNDVAVKAAKMVRVGDKIDAETPGGRKLVDILKLAEKRGPAAVARALYDDKTPPPPPREERVAPRERGAGRPTKRDRRRIASLRRSR